MFPSIPIRLLSYMLRLEWGTFIVTFMYIKSCKHDELIARSPFYLLESDDSIKYVVDVFNINSFYVL